MSVITVLQHLVLSVADTSKVWVVVVHGWQCVRRLE